MAIAGSGFSQTPELQPGQMAPSPKTAQTPDPAMVQFSEIEHNFGKIKQNVPVTHVFTLKNVGTRDIELINVSASCGCTTPNWRGGKFKPGESTQISATYDARSESIFHKIITVVTSEGTHTLILKGEVLNEMAYRDYERQKHTEDSIRQASEKPVKKGKNKKPSKKERKSASNQDVKSSAITNEQKSKRN